MFELFGPVSLPPFNFAGVLRLINSSPALRVNGNVAHIINHLVSFLTPIISEGNHWKYVVLIFESSHQYLSESKKTPVETG